MDDQVCDVFSEVDNLFTKGLVNERKFNNLKKFNSYCPYQNDSKENKCTNDYERINALGSYVFTKISEFGITYKQKKGFSRDIEIFMMWLGEKLFRIDKDYKATLEESYKKNLEKSMGNVNYWKAIDSQNIYKKATVKKMREYYSLLNYICKLIIEYNKYLKSRNRKVLANYSTQCDNHYKTIHNSINGCRPYLYLLDTLKMIFEIFRVEKIVTNNNIKEPEKTLILNRVKPLETFEKENKYFTSVNEMFNFDDDNCREVKSKDEQIGKSIELKKSQDSGKPKNTVRGFQTRGSGNSQRGNTGPTKLQTKPASSRPRPPAQPAASNTPSGQLNLPPPAPAKPASATSLKEPTPPSETSSTPTATKLSLPSPAEQQSLSSESPPIIQPTEQQLPSKLILTIQKGPPDSQGSPNAEVSQSSNQKDTSKDSDSSQHNAPSDIGKQGSDVLDKQKQSEDGKQQISSPKQGNSDGSENSDPKLPTNELEKQPPQSDPEKHKSETKESSSDPSLLQSAQDGGSSQPPQKEGSSHPNGQDASKIDPKVSGSEKRNPNGGINEPGTPSGGAGEPPSGSPAPSQNDKSDITNPLNQAGISSTSGESIDLWSPFFKLILNGKEYYNKTSDFIDQNKQRFNDAKNKISGAYKDAMDNLKSAYDTYNDYLNRMIDNINNKLNQDDTPKPGNSGDNLPQGNENSQKGEDPPQIPPSNGPQPPSPINTPPSTPPKDPAPNPTPASSEQKQPSSQPQHITQQPTQIDPHNHKTSDQLVKSSSIDPNLKKKWNMVPTTWNGSVECKPKINFMNTTLVCCTSEQCSLTGISVTFVLIPIILLIAYKYLSFGSSKKSEKKNMKKVINFHDGKRKTKIIISSNDNKKKLKPVINSVGGKKNSLLNIYKIIQADPMPFINLFFLLIFFVYKRKRDTIE
ncbi:hypothetical protein YYE_04964 [Plasmodium vinckei vinckei]|uniref:PIR protein CIR protein n=1 Tax=Plasmodium vinckei vinckei TaxID=54757 RepID=A0A081I929_PLAVN|nr:hypothetical protein YYE_04964 [Plasmodium vinckei vinckei]